MTKDEMQLKNNLKEILNEMIMTTNIDIIENNMLFVSMDQKTAFWKIMNMFTNYHTEKNKKDNNEKNN